MAQEIIAGEAAKLTEEAYRKVFEENSRNDGVVVDTMGGNNSVNDKPLAARTFRMGHLMI